jgi:hypothetical protein
MADLLKCPKCGSARAHVIGRSVSPAVVYVECPDCGRSTTIDAPKNPVADGDGQRVEQLARRVVADFGLPCTVVAVMRAEGGWEVAVRTEARRVVRVLIKGAGPAALRAAMKDALEGV